MQARVAAAGMGMFTKESHKKSNRRSINVRMWKMRCNRYLPKFNCPFLIGQRPHRLRSRIFTGT